MPEISIHQQGRIIVCFHFQDQARFLVKLFVFKLGDLEVHLCADCAELLGKGLLEQLEQDRQ